MNNIENESIFFVSIERRKVNINNANLKNNKFQDFLKYINRKKINNSVEKASNLRSSYNNISNSNKENFSQKNIANNIINLKANNNIITNKPKHIEKNEEKNDGFDTTNEKNSIFHFMIYFENETFEVFSGDHKIVEKWITLINYLIDNQFEISN